MIDAETYRRHGLAVLAFWRDHAVDREHGGFIPQLDRQGRIYDETVKDLVPSARLVYTMSQGVLLGGPPWCAELARHAADFLRRAFWDQTHAGWFWGVHRDGTPADTRKRTYGHDFAILALTEFHRAVGDPVALDLAERTFDLLEERAWDRENGGYREGYDRVWTALDPPWRTQNSQMHALEALLALHEVTGNPRYRDRIADLCRVMEDHLFDREHACIPEEFHPSGRPGIRQLVRGGGPRRHAPRDPQGRSVEGRLPHRPDVRRGLAVPDFGIAGNGV